MSTLKMSALEDVEGRLKKVNDELHTIFDEAGDDYDMSQVKSVAGDTHAVVARIRELNDEAEELGRKRDELQAVHKAAERVRMAGMSNGDRSRGVESGSEPGGTPAVSDGPVKTIGELFTGSKAYESARTSAIGRSDVLDIDLKTLFQTTAGWDSEDTRTGRVVPFATRPVQVTDLIPQTTTSQSTVVYMEETTFTNAAAETAEGGTYAEAALALTEKTSPVRKIAVFLPVTDEQLEDEPQARGYINNRLPFMLRQRLDGQILTGNGTPPNLEGILNVTGIQTQAKGTDPVPDAVYKAMTKVRVTGRAMPSAVVMHPNDWQDIRLLRTADGIYIWGNPSESGPERIWGLQVVQSDALTENTGLVGDFANFIELANRRGIEVQVSNSHSTYFVEGKQALRADMRAALVVYRPAAFCTVTGI